MTRFTLGQLARGAGLARSSLLHYETLGLLAPAGEAQPVTGSTAKRSANA